MSGGVLGIFQKNMTKDQIVAAQSSRPTGGGGCREEGRAQQPRTSHAPLGPTTTDPEGTQPQGPKFWEIWRILVRCLVWNFDISVFRVSGRRRRQLFCHPC
eukprot:scaffold3057_cov163-Ochromonas_danica.AAC.15